MATTNTLILSQSDIRRTMRMHDYIDAVEEGFRRAHLGEINVPPVPHMPGINGAFHIKSAGFTAEPPYAAVKVNGNFPGNPASNGLPTIQGAIVLSDVRDGRLLAILDSIEVTAMRTAAATAVAARYLAPDDSESLTIAGCGTQGRVHLPALAEVLPLKQVFLFDVDPQTATAMADDMHDEVEAELIPVANLSDGTLQSSVIVTCSSAREPFLGNDHVRPGTFVAAVGADNFDKQELDAELTAGSTLIVDVPEQCAEIGELHQAIKAGRMSADDVAGDLGAIVAGDAEKPRSHGNIVVFDSTGSAFQDVAAAGVIYDRARQQPETLQVFDFGA